MKLKYWLFGSVLLLLVMGVTASQAVSSSPSVHIDDIAISRDSKTLAVSMWSSTPDPSSFMDIADVRYWVRFYQLDSTRYRDLKIADRAWSIAFSPGGRLFATGHRNGAIDIRDVGSGRVEISLAAHDDTIWSLDFSPDGNYLASASMDGSAKLWDVSSGEPVRTIQHEDWVTAISFSPDGHHVATGSRDGNVRIFDVSDGELIADWVGHIGAVRPGAPNPPKGVIDLRYSNDGSLIATGGRDNTLAVWDVNKRALKYRVAEDPRAWTNNVTTVAFSPDGQYVAAGYGENSGEHRAGMVPNGSVFVYRSADGERVTNLPGLKVGVERLFFTRDGTTLIAGGGAWPSTASIVTWDVEARSVKKRFRPGPMDK
ncbi:MAG: WD40 repeat domain-containing protein [Gammaproteobacteria bacterium]|nr:WD40 repeat domain-containing protein [Gammaproteobacteria bacterium]